MKQSNFITLANHSIIQSNKIRLPLIPYKNKLSIVFIPMEDGLEQHMSMLLNELDSMRPSRDHAISTSGNAGTFLKQLDEKKPVATTVIEEQVHPVGLSIVSPKTTSDIKTKP